MTVSTVREGNAIPRATAISTGKTNIQKSASGSRTNLEQARSHELDERGVGRAARDQASRRCLPVKRTKTSSSVALWVVRSDRRSGRASQVPQERRDREVHARAR